MTKYFILMLFCFSFNIVKAQMSKEPQNTRFYYNGQIHNLDFIQMNLHIDNYQVTGAFVMEGTGEYFFVEGRLSDDKKGIGIRVYNALKQYVASRGQNHIRREEFWQKAGRDLQAGRR